MQRANLKRRLSVIRNEKALDRIRAYIANNPARWANDPENISRAVSAEAGRV
jgi:hypothetical protein